MQLTVQTLGGEVARGKAREYGKAEIEVCEDSVLFEGFPAKGQVWMSHGDKVTEIPDGFSRFACTDNTEFAGIQNPEKKIYGKDFAYIHDLADFSRVVGRYLKKQLLEET